MPTFEEKVHGQFDIRTRTLGGIKARSLGADVLTLAALNVLVYAQLEGGIKDLAQCALHDLNSRRLPLGHLSPRLLRWRNSDQLERLKAMVDFDMVAQPSPFSSALGQRFKIRPVNRRREMNQMGWDTIRRVYRGFGLDSAEIDKLRPRITEIVVERNDAAHHGLLPAVLANRMEQRVRDNATVVENVLTDFSLKLLPFFSTNLHLR